MKRHSLLRCLHPGRALRPGPKLTAVALLCSVAGTTIASVSAQTTASSRLETRLELELPHGCGTLTRFVKRLRTRSTRILFTDQGAARTVQARIVAESDGTYRATMTLLYPDGHSSSRIIEARNCGEAIEALALVTAVALDPLSVGSSDSSDSSDITLPPAAATPPIENTALPLPVRRAPEIETTNAAPASQNQLGIGVSFASHWGPTPGWLSGFEPSLRLKSNRQWGYLPAARLGVSYTENRGNQQAGGIADFALASLVLELCPLQLLRESLEIRTCAMAHAGLVFAEGRATAAPESHTRQYWALGGSAEFELMLAGAVGLPLRGGVSVPLVRDTYSFNPTSFYRVPLVAFDVTAGLEVRFR